MASHRPRQSQWHGLEITHTPGGVDIEHVYQAHPLLRHPRYVRGLACACGAPGRELIGQRVWTWLARRGLVTEAHDATAAGREAYRAISR